jgi:hypothetical protein
VCREGVYFKINNEPTILPKYNILAALLLATTTLLPLIAAPLYATFVPTTPTDSRVPRMATVVHRKTEETKKEA